MTILSVVRDVCAAVGVIPPVSVFASINTNRTMIEMLALANEMAQRIAYDTREWGALKKMATFTGDGIVTPPDTAYVGTTAFPLPADYKRMLLTAEVWRSTDPTTPMRFIPDSNEWIRRRLGSDYHSRGEWTLMGGDILIHPVMAGPRPADPFTVPPTPPMAAVTASFAYLQRNCVKLASGGYGDAFLADLDSYVLDERILKLGMIWQWKAQKGSSYAEDMGTYGDALNTASGADSPAPIIIGRLPLSSSDIAYPWQII